MSPFLETVTVLLVIALGITLGHKMSRLKKPYWLAGYCFALTLILLLIAARIYPQLSFFAPLSWIILGRAKFVTLAFAVTLGVTAPLSKLTRSSTRIAFCSAMAVTLFYFSVMPFFAPAILEHDISRLRTRINAHGICFQTTDFTCGPAAAVTAITQMGLHAEEGHIAVLARSSPVSGTLPACLAVAIQKQYGSHGITSRYDHFNSLDQLTSADFSLAIIKSSFFSDHCVTILEITEDSVKFADPTYGIQKMDRKAFENIWRFSAITLSKTRNS